MKVFISWSGETSEQLAKHLHDFLRMVTPDITPFISSGIVKGTTWLPGILNELSETNFGVLCLTSDNLNSKWLMFEAGALAKQTDSKLVTVLFRVDKSAVTLPLNMFQMTLFEEADFRTMLMEMHAAASTKPGKRTEAEVSKAFDRFWPDFKRDADLVLEQAAIPVDAIEPPSPQKIAEETLDLVRQQSSVIGSIDALAAALLKAMESKELGARALSAALNRDAMQRLRERNLQARQHASMIPASSFVPGPMSDPSEPASDNKRPRNDDET